MFYRRDSIQSSWHLPFNSHIRSCVSNSNYRILNGEREKEFGLCWDFTPIIFVNDNYETFASNSSSVSSDDFFYSSKINIRFHEFTHYFSLSGTSLGSLYHILYAAKLDHIKYVLQILRESTFKNKLKPPFAHSKGFINSQLSPEIHLYLMQIIFFDRIKTLFTNSGPFTINYYYSSLFYFLYYWHANKLIRFGNTRQRQLMLSLNIEDLIPDRVNFEWFLKPYDYGYYNDYNISLISVRDILEAYAVCNQLLIYELLRASHVIRPQNVKDFANNVLNDEYHHALSFYNRIVNAGNRLEYPELIATAIPLLELTLMTNFHPYLLPKTIPVDWSHSFLIPQRFQELCYYFFSKNISVKIDDLSDNEYIFQLLDGICNDLNWPKYSKQLDKLKSFNRTFNSWGRSYFAVNSDFVIEIKRKYGILPKHQSTSPYAVVYNDFIDDQFENMYLDKENIDSNIKNKMYDAKCLRDTELKVYLFFEQFFYANDFEEFKNVLMKLNQDSKKNKDQLFKDFLDEFNLESFVDPLS